MCLCQCYCYLLAPQASIYEARVQEERRRGATGIPLLQMQGSVLQDFKFNIVAEKAHIYPLRFCGSLAMPGAGSAQSLICTG